MNKSMKTFIKMSLAFHNLRVLCRCSSVNIIQKSLRHTLKKETLPTSIYKQLGDEPSEIFIFLEKNQEFLSGQHFVQALQKLRKSSGFIDDKNQNSFAHLCEELKKQIRTLDVSEAVVAVGALTKLKVPTETVIYESLLQIIRSNINSLTIDDVINLQLDLKYVHKTPLVEAIQIALPTLFEIQLPRIDRSNINLLAYCLIFATKQKVKHEESIYFILDAIYKYEDKIPVTLAKFIYNSLRFIPEIAYEYKNVLYRVQRVLLEEVSTLTFEDALTMLKSISNVRTKPFYNEHLVDALVNSTIIEANLSYEKGAEAFRMLVTIGHDQVPLLDYLATKFFEQQELVKNINPINLALLVSAMAMSDYQPVFWDMIQELIMTNESIPTYEKLHDFVHDLAILECYSSTLIANTFEQNSQANFMAPHRKRRIVNLYQIVKTLYLQYEGPCPVENQPDEFFEWSQYDSRSFPLLPFLNIVLGGSEFVQTKLGTKFGHFIDHVIVLNKEDGLPVAINQKYCTKNDKNNTRDKKSMKNVIITEKDDEHLNNSENNWNGAITFLEDISISKESQVILFLDIPPDGYTINTRKLKGNWNSYIRTLEAMDYTVIPICSEKWLRLPEKQKLPYLMHAIRLKCAIKLF